MPFATNTERELLQLASEGNTTAFEAIFNRYKDRLYTFIFRFNASHEVTEDIMQEIFLKLWKDREGLSSIEHFSSYLYLMSRNHSINVLKRFAKERLILSQLNRSASCTNNPETIFHHKEAQQELRISLQQLPPQQKLVYILSREHGLKHHEIADRLNISPSTVKNHIVQALRALRQRMRFHTDSMVRCYFFIFLLF